MKIAFFQVTSGKREGGGIETYCWELGKTLAQRGHKTVIFAGENGYIRNEFVSYKGFPFRSRDRFPNLGFNLPKLMERISFARSALPRLIEGAYDMIIINKPTDFPAIWLAKRRGLTANVVFRSGGKDFWPGDKLFAKSVDTWVSCSDFNARQIEERYGYAVNTIYNGVDVNLFSPGKPSVTLLNNLGLSESDKVIMSVGRLVDWKGLEIVIHALKEVSNLYYVVVGEGPSLGKLKSLAKELNVAERVKFVGVVNNKELVNFYRLAKCLMQPSIGYESFSITILEAMSCGLPVLGTKKGGIPEAIVHNETGKLIDSHDPELWVEAIREVITNETNLEIMGQKARERVEKHFTWSVNAKQLEEIIRK